MEEIDFTKLGRKLMDTGALKEFREGLGLTRTTMADLLHTSTVTYTTWEAQTGVYVWPATAERIGRFYIHAQKQVELLAADGVNLQDLVPLHIVASRLGVPQEVLLKRYRAGEFVAEDLGVLGLWLRADMVPELALR
jgi:hypothetical protein